MLLKLAGAVLIIAGTTFLGRERAECFLLRAKELRLLRQAVLLLEGEIGYTLTLLPEALRRVADNSDEPVKNLLRQTADKLQKGQNAALAWTASLEEARSDFSLKLSDWEILRRLGSSLGLLDCTSQLKQLALTREYLLKQEEEAKIEGEKKAYLWRYFGTALGFMLVILFF